jgi:hypothetical protein
MPNDLATLIAKGFVRMPDGSYTKVAPVAQGVCAAKPEYDQVQTLELCAKNKARGVGRARVRFVRCGTHRLDRDNAFGSIKNLLDGLVKAALIPGDSEEEIELIVEQKTVKRAEIGTLIEIEPL